MGIHIHETLKLLNRLSAKRATLRHIIIKLLKDKERNLKSETEK